MANLEKIVDELSTLTVLEAAELEAKAAALAVADREMRNLNRRQLLDGIDVSKLRPLREWEDITRLRGVRAKRLREFVDQGADLGLMELRPVWLVNPDVASRLLPLRKALFETVAIARGTGKQQLAAELGAHHYLDSTTGDIAQQLQSLGGASVVLATAMSSEAMGATIDGLRPNGELLVLGATPEPIPVTPFQILPTSRTIHGHPSGTAKDVEDAMRFAALSGVRPLVETYSLDEITPAYDRMLSGDARFRVVLTTGR